MKSAQIVPAIVLSLAVLAAGLQRRRPKVCGIRNNLCLDYYN